MNDASLHAALLSAQIRDLKHQCLVLAMGLYGQNENEMAVETARVLALWTPAVEFELGLREPELYDREPTDEAMEKCRRTA